MNEPQEPSKRSYHWLALIIGNTRLHWGYFYQKRLVGTWHTPHLTAAIAAHLIKSQFQATAWQNHSSHATPHIRAWTNQITCAKTAHFPKSPVLLHDLWIASAVPDQAQLWEGLGDAMHIVVRSHIPIAELYETIGIDRAITLLGAGATTGWPCLVIDGGTALTFTAAKASRSEQGEFYGGAILPGLRLQREALSQKTAVLADFVKQRQPEKVSLSEVSLPEASSLEEEPEKRPVKKPERWAKDSVSAIASGLHYSLTATLIDYLQDWWQQFPQGTVLMTGGDAPLLHRYLQQRTPEIASRVQVNSSLMFYGMQAYRQSSLSISPDFKTPSA